MEKRLVEELELGSAKSLGQACGGCINEGNAYDTDKGKIFVKINSKPKARLMFDGEFASLEALTATGCVRVPKPWKVLELGKGQVVLVMELLDLSGNLTRHAGRLGKQMARLHLHNAELGRKAKKEESSVHRSSAHLNHVSQFGFHVPTCCGYLEQQNTWMSDWVEFYARKLDEQIKMLEKRGDHQARELFGQLEQRLPAIFSGVKVEPALLHGDLWGGNVGASSEEPVIYDPASFYGHCHFDLAIAEMFGGLPNAFYQSYYALLPQEPGHAQRMELYKLFHYLNHWNHFGGGYKSSSIRIMKSLGK